MIAEVLRNIVQAVFGGGADVSLINPIPVTDISLPKYQGLIFAGTVSGIAGAPNFQCSDLTGYGNDYFEGYWAYVVWDAAGGGGAPQGQSLVCTGYVSATGDFTVNAFAPGITVGDKILLIHPSVAYMLGLTPARAALLDTLSIIAAGGAGELTPARAALLSNLDAAISSRAPGATALSTADWPAALATALSAYTAAKAAFLDIAISSRAPGATALSNADWPAALATALSAYTAAKAAFIDIAISSRSASGEAAAALAAAAYTRQAGVQQTFTKQITSAANAGDVLVATITTQPCKIKSIVLRSNGATTANLTNAAIYGGAAIASHTVTFIDTVTGLRANIDTADKQVWWEGRATFAAAKVINITLTGTGAAAVDLQVDIEYEAIVSGGYLA